METEETVYQYYTIINSDADAFISNDETAQLTYVKNENDDDDKIMYLSLGQEEDVFSSDLVLGDNVKNENASEIPNIEFISIANAQMFMADSLTENFTAVDPEIISCNSNESSLFLTENSSKTELSPNDNEGDYRKIELEDGSCAYIDKSLWNSLIDIDDSSNKEEQNVKKKKFACSYYGCDKVYTTAHHLTVHIRNHTGSRPFHCTVDGCEKAFATGYSLKAHLRTHTGEAPYCCSVCPKQFKTSGDLQKHVRTHTGEKPFKCPVEGCGRSFTTSNIRKVHIRSHTGERPYACTYADCGKAFASATNFKNHMRIHSGEKPYECTVQGCGKRFTEYSSLFKHNAVHKPFKNLKCEYCDQLCKHETTLRAHKQAMHKILITDDGSEIRLTKEY